MAKLRGLAGQIRRQEPVDITSATYSVLRELVLTELSAYSVVRIGAWVRMPYRSFVRSKPAWQQGNSVDTRPVTTPPDNACNHQKVGKTSSAMSGFDKMGNCCCDEAVSPTCFITVKDQDKGGKTDGQMVFSHEAFQLVLDFLLVMENFFRNRLPEVFAEWKQNGNGPIFLSSTGKDPGPTSGFRLKIFNKAVFDREGEIVITPQNLRKFNTTYLNQHPDNRVRSARGAGVVWVVSTPRSKMQCSVNKY